MQELAFSICVLTTVWQKPAGYNGPLRSVAERSYPLAKVRGGSRKELPHDRGQGRWLRGAPHVQGVVAAWVQLGQRSYSTSKVRRGGRKEIPLVQQKEQRLRFAGAAVNRYQTSKVRETQIRM